MACLGLEEALSLRKNDVYSSNLQQQTSKGKAGLLGHRFRGGKFSSSSAQDLRCFEMKKEKEDCSSPRGVLEACIRGVEPEAGSSKTNISESEVSSSNSKAHPRWHRFFRLWKTSSIKQLSSFPSLAVPKISRGKSRSVRENVDANHYYFQSSWKNFTYPDLRTATNNFSQENLIGKGGYAEVYKGCLADGQLVAVKRLNKGTLEEQITSFLSEIGTIAHVNHPNTAKLIGFGVEGGRFLVLELSPLGSLGSLLRGPKEKLNWAVRHKIILGTAAGLLYLHENCQRRIIHRDIKADNILLTDDFEPQICDFGLAKWLPKDWTHHYVPKFEGTFGYFAPEYFMHGIVDEKTDVFSYGVLLLELITGREALDDSKISIVLWAKPLLDNNSVEELVDPSLGDHYDPDEMDRVILTASLCIEQTPILRPRMSQVLILLKGESYIVDSSKESQNRSLQRTFSEELLDAEEYNSTKYLSDLNRHKEVALGSSNQ
ncbi:receptor-like cytosolic serine/threonine-protein kinase RBK2 isoform X1 [Camellia sinensis]|uniref:receptor-like cytosolic serine/threonine-protein kinase RBK2 isoform X1 n=2 Tax=Camellia sinensis TaxID=4442 RepID=UPI001036108A|nr:receptor-like cytosolic serine/threonine-protein kinase RBK2 isoform X1 [Camellia sinensis]